MATDNAALAFLLIFTEGIDQVVFTYDGTANRFTYLNPAFEKIWRKRQDKVRDNPATLWKNVLPEEKS